MNTRWVGRRWLAALLVVSTWTAGCATKAQQGDTATGPASTAAAPADNRQAAAFEVVIRAPDDVRAYLQRHLELMQYRALADLDDAELERLALAADRNVRDLLGTLGYFSPEIDINRMQPLDGAGSMRVLRITVQTGPATTVQQAAVQFQGAIADDAAAASQRSAIRDNWKLPVGKPFTQQAWSQAKTQALRLLAAQRYPLGRIAASRAEIDPDRQQARLDITLDSGPAYKLGAIQINGLTHYEPALVERIARLKPGTDYDQASLLEAQQRLQDSGHFNSVALEIDPAGDPQAVPVIVTVREARRSNLQIGVGISTDSGPRLSLEHTNHQIPLLGWRAVSKLALDRDLQSIDSELTAPPDDGNWSWVTSGQLKNEDAASVKVRSQKLRAGRVQLGDRIDRNYYLQYDRAATTAPGVNQTAQTISVNYAWTQRNFDRLPYPSSGYGLGAEVGGGWTLGSQRQPYLRTRVNWLGLFSLSSDRNNGTNAGAGRIAIRAQAGAVLAKDDLNLPSTRLFLTGGDATVRGYGFNSIGAREASGIITPGRYLAGGSVEWQRPILVDGRPSEWESTVFVDVGAVADKPSELKARVGFGTGVRYRSPVGPLQLDLAYGVDRRKLRLHLSVGLTF